MARLGSIRHAVLAAACGLGMFAAATTSADAQTVEYRGVATFYSFSKACIDDGWSEGDESNMRYRPAKLGDNGNRTRLGFHFSYWATGFIKETGKIGSSFTKVIGQGFSTNGYEYPFKPKIRFMQHKPAKIKNATKRVRLKGEIQGFSDLKDCTAKFKAALKLG